MKNLVRKTSVPEKALAKVIMELLKGDGPVALKGGRKLVKLSKELVKLLKQIFSIMKQGKSVVVMAAEKEVTTEEAAKIWDVRKILIGLLDLGAMPFRKVGRQRRMLLGNVLAYKKEKERTRKILDAMAQESQDLGLGYQ